MRFRLSTHRLWLAHAFGTARESKTFVDNVFVELSAEHPTIGRTVLGYGEACPYKRNGESVAHVAAELTSALNRIQLHPLFTEQDDGAVAQSIGTVCAEAAMCNSARSGLDMALWDWWSRCQGRSLGDIWQLPSRGPLTSFTIGLDGHASMAQRAQEAMPYPLLKVKLGGRDDRAAIEAIREVSDKPLRVDANEGWPDAKSALSMIRWLAQHDVQFVEQPLKRGSWSEMSWLKKRSPLPLIADEDVRAEVDWNILRESYHGINIKLDKCGGLSAARDQLRKARVHGLQVMVGCYVASSLAITAAAHIAMLADWADLDGHLLLKSDPCRGLRLDTDGCIVLPPADGLAVTLDTPTIFP